MSSRRSVVDKILALPWDIEAKETEEDEGYCKDFIPPKFDTIIDQLWQDASDLPASMSVRVQRVKDG